jgi:hypothetical protein
MASRKKKDEVPKDVFLKSEQLHYLLRFDAELKNAQLVAKVAELEWRVQLQAHNARMAKLAADTKAASSKFKEVALIVGKAYNIDMKEYAYDPETGRLSKIHEDPEPFI